MSEELPKPSFEKPEGCASCPLFEAPGPVWGRGPENARTVLVGEAPGADEVDWPKHRPDRFAPFVGGSGRLLSGLMQHAGIARTGTFITNAVKCRPPNNRTPTTEEVASCYPLLRAELSVVNPNVTIALGETALQALTGKTGIGNRRGVPTEGFDGRKVFPTWHPAFIARAQYNWAFACHDLVRAAKESAFSEIRRVPFDIIVGADAAADRAGLLSSARARGAATFDFETSGLSPVHDQIVLLGVAASSDKAHVLDWSGGARDVLQTLLDDPAIEIVGQNILYFDLPFAEAKGIDISKAWLKVLDTMVVFHLINASYGQTQIRQQGPTGTAARGMEKDLTMIASCHTDIEYWKARENYKGDLRKVCGTDCIATDRSALDPVSGLKRELEILDMTDFYYKHVLPVHPVLHRMTKLGVKIDENRAAAWSVTAEREADSLEATLREGLGDPYLNLDSPKQLMTILYEKLKLPIQFTQDQRTKARKPTVNAEALQTLSELAPENAILGTIIQIRQLRKLKSTYIDDALLAGRVHPRFGVSKTATGRFNSWEPNAQNVPEMIRDIWIPDSEEELLIAGDWSQIEWRLAMVLSGDPVGLELLSSGVDNHRAIAAEVLGKPLESVTADERHAAKFIVYGLGYGRGAESLAKGAKSGVGSTSDLAMSPQFIASFIPRFFSRFRVYKDWRDRNVAFADKNHYLVNPFKRRRWWYTYGAATEQFNFPMQSTAADMMYDALVQLDNELPKGATLRLTVHDEVVINTPKDVAKQALLCTREVMQRRWPQIVEASANPQTVEKYYPSGWFCPVDAHLGTNWQMCKSKDPAIVSARVELERAMGI